MGSSIRRGMGCVGLLGLLGLGLPASAADCGPYRVGLREYPLIYERQPDGSYQGLDKDFFAALTERSGCTLELRLESQPRIWTQIKAGQLDIASWVIPTEERAALVAIITMLRTRPMAITWRERGMSSEAEFLADRARRAVVIRKASYGAGYDALIRQLRAQGRISEVADFDAALRVFASRKVDLMIAYPWSLAGHIELDRLHVADWQPGAPGVTSGLALSRSTVRDADQQRLLHALREMERDGTLAQIVNRHMPPPLAMPVPIAMQK